MIISLVQQKGGVGKSTIVAHAAGHFIAWGKRVAVLDADPAGAVSRWLPEATRASRIVHLVDPDAIIDEIPRLQDEADVVLVDGPAGATEVTRVILLRSDMAVVPLGPSALDLAALKSTLALVRQAQSIRDGKPDVAVVVNRAQLHVTVSREVIEAVHDLGVPVARTIIRQRAAIADAPGQGKLAHDMGYAAKPAAGDFEDLFRELFQ